MQIRGHTLLCLQGFRGEGYSPGFVENLAAIHRQLEQQPDTLVEIMDAPDAVCGACPHQQSAGCTLNGRQSEDEMREQDHDVLARLGLEAGTVVAWREILHRIGASLTGAELPEICGQCRWLPLGYCKEGIERLRIQEQNNRGRLVD
jgi:hypothetical protein